MTKTKSDLNFLNEIRKEFSDMEGISIGSVPPRYAYNTGNYALNYITSGSVYKGGIGAQGRIGNISGPSGAGKSFLCANIIREAQKDGAFVLILDSENALDSEFLAKIGVDTENDFMYIGVTTVQQVTNIVSQFLKKYKAEHGTSDTAPQVLVVIDSVSMLLTESQSENYEKGVQKGDQGQKNKNLKLMLQTFVQDIKHLNVAMIVTSHVYKSQEMFATDPWVISDAVKYAASTITLVTNTKLKEKSDQGTSVSGIKMRCEGKKIRYTRPFQVVVIDVPYSEGADPNSGLLELALAKGVIEKTGSRYKIVGEDKTWYEKNISEYTDKILPAIEQNSQSFVKIEQLIADDLQD